MASNSPVRETVKEKKLPGDGKKQQVAKQDNSCQGKIQLFSKTLLRGENVTLDQVIIQGAKAKMAKMFEGL